MLGAITKARFFADAMLDATGLRVLARVAIRSDDNLLRAMARFLEEEGVPITDPTPFLADRLAPRGRARAARSRPRRSGRTRATGSSSRAASAGSTSGRPWS